MTRFVVASSLPAVCTVCSAHQTVQLIRGVVTAGSGVGAWTRCPHCGPDRIPIVHLAWRDDTPRKAS